MIIDVVNEQGEVVIESDNPATLTNQKFVLDNGRLYTVYDIESCWDDFYNCERHTMHVC